MTTALPRYTGHVVGGLLDASPQPGSRARRDNGCTLRTHFGMSLYGGGEGRREGRRFTKNDNVIVPCLLVIGPSMPPPLRSRMNFQGNRLGRGLVVCTLNRLGCTYTFEHAVASATLRLEQTWENYGPASANLLARE